MMKTPSMKLLDRVRQRIRLQGYSIRTEKSYVSWIRRYILFHGKRHPRAKRALIPGRTSDYKLL